ncbi:MAG: hypothetical protein WBC78_00485, partial [Candidatus Sulfotelmatobacter sp.]
TGNAINAEGNASAGPAGNAANQSLAHDVPISGQPVTSQVLKSAVHKPASRDSDADVAAGSTAASNPDDSSVKPAKAPPKPPSAQLSPQPPASDDNPH